MNEREALKAMRRLGEELGLAALNREAEEALRLPLTAIGMRLAVVAAEHINVLAIGRRAEARHSRLERADKITAESDDRRHARIAIVLALFGDGLTADMLFRGFCFWCTRARR